MRRRLLERCASTRSTMPSGAPRRRRRRERRGQRPSSRTPTRQLRSTRPRASPHAPRRERRRGRDDVDRWHDLEQSWEDESVPLPQTEADREAERDRLEETRRRSRARAGARCGRCGSSSHPTDETQALADRLEQEGTARDPALDVPARRRRERRRRAGARGSPAGEAPDAGDPGRAERRDGRRGLAAEPVRDLRRARSV